jgi:uncharacterized protein YjiS (DUF1127 family)
MNTLAISIPGGRDRGSRLLAFLANLFGGLRDGLRLARHYRELSELSDAQLARRGLKRCDIARAAVAMTET